MNGCTPYLFDKYILTAKCADGRFLNSAKLETLVDNFIYFDK